MSYLAKMEMKMATCPFNANHRVSASRIQFHIVKCMKNYPNHLVCPYNASHRMLKDELNEHLAICPDKKYMDPQASVIGERHSVDSIVNKDFNLEYENWSE